MYISHKCPGVAGHIGHFDGEPQDPRFPSVDWGSTSPVITGDGGGRRC